MDTLDSLGPVKNDFPVFEQRELVFLDSAASAQKPASVINTISELYQHQYANVHRGVYELSEKSTALYEGCREKVRRFINASSLEEIILTSGATQSINLLAYTLGQQVVTAGAEVLSTVLEHHSNFVPWQQLAEKNGAKVVYAGLNSDGSFSHEEFSEKLSSKTKLVAITHVANGFGLKLPIAELIKEAHAAGALVLLDAAQSTPHTPIDVQQLDVDFLAFSGHKVYGPTGIGVLFGKKSLLEALPPFQYGGDMIAKVSFGGTTFNELPYRFEAGTPNIAGAAGLGAAIDYVNSIGMERIQAFETHLVRLLEARLAEISGVNILGPLGQHTGLVCFTVDNLHPHDVAQALNNEGVCVRAGHHCAQPLLEYLGIQASTRASLGVYNTPEDIEALALGIEKAKKFFS